MLHSDDLFYAFVLTQCEILLPREVLLLIEKTGSAKAAFDAPLLLYQQVGVTANRFAKVKALQKKLPEFEKAFLQLARHNIQILHYDQPEFPTLLKHTAACPYLLFYRGTLPDFSQNTFLAVVGTRHATDYGRAVLAQFVPEFCRAGLSVVSGLAFGIDAWAHDISTCYPQRSLAILAKGVEQATPHAQQHLFEKICTQGCVMSEFAFSQGLQARHFPRRNRIVSGLCAGVLVVEAPIKSGALITAHFALEQNRNVYAVPSAITQKQSLGCLQLIKLGAKLVCEPKDILEDYALTTRQNFPMPALPLLSSLAEEVLLYCQDAARHKEEIHLHFAASASQLSATLTQLELDGFLTQINGQFVCVAAT